MDIKDWLVVSNIAFMFHHIWDVILPIDVHIFQRGWSNQPDEDYKVWMLLKHVNMFKQS